MESQPYKMREQSILDKSSECHDDWLDVWINHLGLIQLETISLCYV